MSLADLVSAYIGCWHKAKDLKSELRSCKQVEVPILTSLSLISLVVSADVKQHLKNEAKDLGCQSLEKTGTQRGSTGASPLKHKAGPSSD